MAFNNIVRRGPLSVTAGEILTQGNLVVLDSAGDAVIAGASSVPLGIVQETTASGDRAAIEPMEGIWPVVALIPIAIGNYVQSGTGGKLTVKTPAVAATTILHSSGVAPTDGDTVTLGATTYTFVDTLTVPAEANEVVIGTAAVSLDNLQAAVNGAAGVGVTYSTGTVANTQYTATTNTATDQTFRAIVLGTAGNAFVSTVSAVTLTFPAVTWATPGTGVAQDGGPTAFTLGQAYTAATAADQTVYVASLR